MKRVLIVTASILALSATQVMAQYRDPEPEPDAGAAVGAAIVGGILGGVLGAAIGGRGHRENKVNLMEPPVRGGKKGGAVHPGGGKPGGAGQHRRKPQG